MYDVVIVGGGIAGLQAALLLGRATRRVLVLDAGKPRNTPAEHAHGLVSRDGISPLELLSVSRDELQTYPSVSVEADVALEASVTDEGFRLALQSGREVTTRKLLLASGVVDMLPEVPGMQELWGRGVYHCPFCHGWEICDTPWGLLSDAHIEERVTLFRGWASELHVLTDGPSAVEGPARARLGALGATVDERRIAAVEADGNGVRVTFDDGAPLSVGGIFVVAPQTLRSPLAESLGCELHEQGPVPGSFVKVDAMTGETTVSGVYAAGDMLGTAQSLILAASSGARAAYALTRALAMEDAEAVLVGAGVA